jgi:hypothetical protein
VRQYVERADLVSLVWRVGYAMRKKEYFHGMSALQADVRPDFGSEHTRQRDRQSLPALRRAR